MTLTLNTKNEMSGRFRYVKLFSYFSEEERLITSDQKVSLTKHKEIYSFSE